MSKNNPAFEKQLMLDLCRYIEAHSNDALTLDQIAEQAGLSASHLQRRFKAVIGISPKEYIDASRLKKLKEGLGNSSVTNAIYDAGYSSASRVYERAAQHLGMTPKQYRAKGKGMVISYASYPTLLGEVMLGATDRGLCFIQFGENLLDNLKSEYPSATHLPMDATHKEQFSAWMTHLSAYLKGEIVKFDLPLDVQGTAFQMKVWKYLQTIPSGSVQSYTEVAKGIGQPTSVRAVASACAKNTIAIVIPCHRVLRGSGELAGYRWGVERKRALLDLERRQDA